MNRTSSLTLALVIGAGALTGCGAAADKVAEKATEKAIESQTGGDVDVNTNGDGSFNIETDDGSLSIGTGKLPDGWPDDISIPEDFKIVSGSSTNTGDGQLFSVTATTDASPEDAMDELSSQFDGWDKSGESNMSSGDGSWVTHQYEQDGRQVSITATGDGEQTSVSITHTTSA